MVKKVREKSDIPLCFMTYLNVVFHYGYDEFFKKCQEVGIDGIIAKANIIVARISVIAISIIAVFLASNPNSSVFQIVSFAWAGFGATFGPVVLFSLFWKRSNKYGAIAGMISGGIMVFVWKYLVRPNVSFLNFYELLPAFLVSCAMIVIVSLATKAPSKEIIDEFETVQKRMAE